MSEKETTIEINSSVFDNGMSFLLLIVYIVECNGCGIINQLGVGR